MLQCCFKVILVSTFLRDISISNLFIRDGVKIILT